MSVVLMDNQTMSGKRFFITKNHAITTNYAEADKFKTMVKAVNFLNAMPKHLRKYRFQAFYSEALESSPLKEQDIELLQSVLGTSKSIKIPKITKKNETFNVSTKTFVGSSVSDEFFETIAPNEDINNNSDVIDAVDVVNTEEIEEIKVVNNIEVNPAFKCSVLTDYSIDGATKYIEELYRYVNDFKNFFDKVTIELEEKREQMSECDKKIASLNHLLEFYGERMNACEHYKVSNEIDKIVKRRRFLKNEIAIGKKIKESFDLTSMIKKVVKEYEGIKNPTYRAEYYQDWFEAKENRRSIV